MSLQNDMLNNERESNSEHLKIIKQLFHPKSVAVIGASTTRLKGGYRILENLVGNKFEGAIYPINPKGGEALGLKFYKSLDEISDPIDIAIIFVPNRLIPGILNECIKKGIRGAIIEAAGFEEVGEAGLKLRDEVVKVTDNFKKIRIVGPNCTGLTRVDSSESGFFSAFIRHYNYRRGNVAIISQSGMVNGGYFNYLNTTYENMRVKYVASIGNKMDLGENEFLEYYLEDEDVQVIPIYLESFKDPRKFIELCSRRNYEDGGKNNKNTIKSGNKRRKSIILLKGGITEQGKMATGSHTGALAENTALTEGLIKQARVIRAHSFHELFLIARVHSMLYSSGVKFPKNNQIAFVTVSGGAGTVVADLSMQNGLIFPELSEEAYKELENIYPKWMPPNKRALADLWPAIESANVDSNGIHRIALNAILSDDRISGLMMSLFNSPEFEFDLDIVIKLRDKYQKPIFCWTFGDAEKVVETNKILNRENIPTFDNLEEMIKSYKTILQ